MFTFHTKIQFLNTRDPVADVGDAVDWFAELRILGKVIKEVSKIISD